MLFAYYYSSISGANIKNLNCSKYYHPLFVLCFTSIGVGLTIIYHTKRHEKIQKSDSNHIAYVCLINLTLGLTLIGMNFQGDNTRSEVILYSLDFKG